MKIILDIPEERASFFEELINSFDYVSVIKIVKDPKKSKRVLEMAEAFNDAKLHEQGKKKLKTAKEFFNEL